MGHSVWVYGIMLGWGRRGARGGRGRVRGNHLVQLNSTRSLTPILPTTPQKQQAPEILLRKAKCISREETFPSYTFYSKHKDTAKIFLLIRNTIKKRPSNKGTYVLYENLDNNNWKVDLHIFSPTSLLSLLYPYFNRPKITQGLYCISKPGKKYHVEHEAADSSQN